LSTVIRALFYQCPQDGRRRRRRHDGGRRRGGGRTQRHSSYVTVIIIPIGLSKVSHFPDELFWNLSEVSACILQRRTKVAKS